MKLSMLAAAALSLGAITPASADPIHATTNGEYWHHDSGWIFPERIGEFVRVSAPQDVAGSRDAVAYYARTLHGARVVVSVDVFPSDSAAGATTLEGARGLLQADTQGAKGQLAEDTLPIAGNQDLHATRLWFTPAADTPAQGMYFVTSGEWRVRIRVTVPTAAGELRKDLDAFALAQRWDTLH